MAPLHVHAQGGVPIWTNRYSGQPGAADGGRGIATDSSGNVIVTGAASAVNGFPNFGTIKYSNAGTPLWTNRYTGFTNSGALPFAVATDAGGKIFVTGYSGVQVPPIYATVAYSAAGSALWTNYYSAVVNGGNLAQAIAVDSSSNVIVTGVAVVNPGSSYATIKYSNSGTPIWTNRYDGPATNSTAYALAVDNSNNVIVTGGSAGVGSGQDIATLEYSGAGTLLWSNRYNGPGNGADRGYAVAVDGKGNVFVTGFSVGTGGDQEFVTLAYNSAGTPLWTNRYHGPTGGDDEAVAIALDSSANVFVTGISGSTADYATIKYSNAGAPLWTNRYNGPATNYDAASALEVDSSGNVIVTGAAPIGVNGSGNATNGIGTVAYSNSGTPLWTNVYGPAAPPQGPLSALALDNSGNVFVTGAGIYGNFGYVTIKYSSSVSSNNAVSPIALNFANVSAQLVLSWTNPVFKLYTAPIITATFTNIPGATSPYTNPMSGPEQYFRLEAN